MFCLTKGGKITPEVRTGINSYIFMRNVSLISVRKIQLNVVVLVLLLPLRIFPPSARVVMMISQSFMYT